MILADIQAYVRERGQVTVGEAARHVGAEPDAVRNMLELLLAKGRVHRLPLPAACGTGCCQCNAAGDEIYAWGAEPESPQIVVVCRTSR
jgi:putative ferrous iron transport protein C